MKRIEIFNKEIIVNKDRYNFIINEIWYNDWYKMHTKRRKPKYYAIKKNGKYILHTSQHQVFYARMRSLENGGE